MGKNFLSILFILSILFLYTSCEKDDPDIPHEEELITTVTYTLTPTSGGAAVTLSFKDVDGDGGDEPTITGGVLAPNQMYTGSLVLLNEIESPAEDITAEIAMEAEEHQFFFQSSISDLSISYDDQDMEGNPIGLSNTLTTGNAATGTITVTLRHEPKKSATGVSEGDITHAEGETDIEIIFPIDVQ